MRDDKLICINPFHFILDRTAALRLQFYFPADYDDAALCFSKTPQWQASLVNDVYIFHRVGAEMPLDQLETIADDVNRLDRLMTAGDRHTVVWLPRFFTAAAMPDWLANTSSRVRLGTWPSTTCST